MALRADFAFSLSKPGWPLERVGKSQPVAGLASPCSEHRAGNGEEAAQVSRHWLAQLQMLGVPLWKRSFPSLLKKASFLPEASAPTRKG